MKTKPKKCCYPDCYSCPYVDCRWDCADPVAHAYFHSEREKQRKNDITNLKKAKNAISEKWKKELNLERMQKCVRGIMQEAGERFLMPRKINVMKNYRF